MKSFLIAIPILLFLGCKKDSTKEIEPNLAPLKTFAIGQKFANGVITQVFELDNNNFGLHIIGLQDFTNLSFNEAFDKVSSLKDEFGVWNMYSLGMIDYFTYNPIIEDSLIKHGGSIIKKNERYWINQFISREKPYNFYVENNFNVSGNNYDLLSNQKLNVRPVRIVTYYNKPIKSYKSGDPYKFVQLNKQSSAIVLSVDTLGRKLKVFAMANEYPMTWDEAELRTKTKFYDGEYGYRMPTIDEVKEIQKLFPTYNLSCWTATIDGTNPNLAVVYNTNNSPQTSSVEKTKFGNFAKGLIGIKEVSY